MGRFSKSAFLLSIVMLAFACNRNSNEKYISDFTELSISKVESDRDSFLISIKVLHPKSDRYIVDLYAFKDKNDNVLLPEERLFSETGMFKLRILWPKSEPEFIIAGNLIEVESVDEGNVVVKGSEVFIHTINRPK